MTSRQARLRALRAAPLLAAACALAGCQTDGTAAPAARAAPVSHHAAALECWMATEHGHADLPLDKRANLVDACIKDRMAGKPLPAALTAEHEGKPKEKPKAKSRAKKPRLKPDAKPKPPT